MPRKRKLTPKLKEQIKKEYKKLNKTDFDGEALHYLNRVKGAAKARKTKAAYFIKIDKETTIDKRTGIYEFIQEGAGNKNQSVKEFIKDNRELIKDLIDSGYTHVQNSHADKLEKQIEDLKGNKKIINKGVAVSKPQIMSYISQLQNAAAEAGFYDYIPIEVAYDLKGNMILDIPTQRELLDVDKKDLGEFLDENYPNIRYHKK